MSLIKIIVTIIFSLTFTALFSQYSSTELAPILEPVSNNAVTGITINNQKFVYSFGGIDSSKSYSGIHNRSFKYSVSNNTWSAIPDLPTSPTRIAAGASTIKDQIYIIGGYHVLSNGNEQSSSLVHRFDPSADTFLTNGANIPKSIDDHVQATYKDSLIFVVTGWSQSSNVPDVQIYNPSIDTWLIGTSVPNNNNYKSFGASGAIIGDTIYYFGGARYGTNFPVQNQLRKGYINPNNVTDITWSIDTIHPDLVGYRMAAASYNNEIRWIGGSNATYNYDGIGYAGNVPVEPNHRILTFHPFTNSWDTVSISKLNMDLRGVAAFDCEVIVVGGMDTNQTVSNRTLKISCTTTSSQDKKLQTNEMQIFPNPASDYIQLTNIIAAGELSIYSIYGSLVLSQHIEHKQNINISHLLKGTYIISFTNNQQNTSTQLFIKQ